MKKHHKKKNRITFNDNLRIMPKVYYSPEAQKQLPKQISADRLDFQEFDEEHMIIDEDEPIKSDARMIGARKRYYIFDEDGIQL